MKKNSNIFLEKKDLDLNLLSMLSLPRCEFPMNTKINPKKKKRLNLIEISFQSMAFS